MSLYLTESNISERLHLAFQPGVITSSEDSATLSAEREFIRAAVLVPLCWNANEWHLILTHRTNEVEHHKGQVSFPGGGCAGEAESVEQTALREAWEEIGLLPDDVRLLGRLNEMITVTGFRVTPVVGVIPWSYDFHLSTIEVERVFSIPLTWLAQSNNWVEYNFTPDGTQHPFRVISYHPYGNETLWGVSARITQELVKLLGLI